MPLENILFLCLVVGAFAVFGIVLAYGEWTTRHIQDTASVASPRAKPDRAHGDVRKKKDTVYETAA